MTLLETIAVIAWIPVSIVLLELADRWTRRDTLRGTIVEDLPSHVRRLDHDPRPYDQDAA